MADTLERDAVPDSEDRADGSRGAPWHFWAVTAVALLWNGFPALDYTMTQLGNAEWVGQIEPARLRLIKQAPAWATAAWALGGWSAFIGAILMVVRSRHAPAAFLVSLLAAAVSFAWQYAVGLVETPVLPIVILASIVFFWRYAAAMRAAGVLR